MPKHNPKKHRPSVVHVSHVCSYLDCENKAEKEFMLQYRDMGAIVEIPRPPYHLKYACHMHWEYIKSALSAVGKIKSEPTAAATV